MALSPTSSKGVTSSAVSSVFTRTGAIAAADGDYYGVVAAAKTGATATSRYVGATASGAPVAGTFAVGDLVVDQAGGAWTCTVAGTPGTWSPAVAAGSVTNTHIAAGAAIAATKVQGGTASLGVGMQLLSTTTLGSDTTFDVSGISQSYTDLILVLMARSSTASVSGQLILKLNNDGSALYDNLTTEVHNATAVNSGGSAGGTSWTCANNIAGNTSPANQFSFIEIFLPGYTSTTWFKPFYCLYQMETASTSAGQFWGSGSGLYNSTAAINRVTLTTTGTNFKTGSQLRIYGRL